jgi:hypothetical protein
MQAHVLFLKPVQTGFPNDCDSRLLVSALPAALRAAALARALWRVRPVCGVQLPSASCCRVQTGLMCAGDRLRCSALHQHTDRMQHGWRPSMPVAEPCRVATVLTATRKQMRRGKGPSRSATLGRIHPHCALQLSKLSVGHVNAQTVIPVCIGAASAAPRRMRTRCLHGTAPSARTSRPPLKAGPCWAPCW